MWPNQQFPADLVTFTGEILNGKLHFFVQCIFLRIALGTIHKGCPHIFSDFWPPLPIVHICPYLADPPFTPCPCVHKLWIWDIFFNKNQTPNIYLHHPSFYTDTNKVNHMVKYLLKILIQDGNRERYIYI